MSLSCLLGSEGGDVEGVVDGDEPENKKNDITSRMLVDGVKITFSIWIRSMLDIRLL